MFVAQKVKFKFDGVASEHVPFATTHGVSELPLVIAVQAAVVFAKFEQTAATHVELLVFQKHELEYPQT